MNSLKIGLLGMGTVGGGTYNVLKDNADAIGKRTGKAIDVIQVANRNTDKAKQVVGDSVAITGDAFELVNNPEIDVVVELIGGTTVAKDLVMQAIANGKHVVTANKALIALHGNEVFAAAKEKGVMVAYEAAVAGGIPIIKALREGLSANQIEWVAGIINGTTNFILTEMLNKGLAFDDVLGEAQRLGYAEADPTFDVEGIDAAHKLAIMAAIAFGMPMKFDDAYTEGITQLTQKDVQYAQELGYRIKLLGIAKRVGELVELRVHPTLIPETRLVANVDGAMNAVVVKGNAVGPTLYYGAGAGAAPTASAVVADIIDVARQVASAPETRVPSLGFGDETLTDITVMPISEVNSAYYLRICAKDQAGVMAEVTKVLAEYQVSIDQMHQKEHPETEADIVILTHETVESTIDQVIAAIEALEAVAGTVVKIRMEPLSA